jgi:hypothetical protein
MSGSVLRGAESIELSEAVHVLNGVPTDYDPLLDLIGNYFFANLPQPFDAVIHFDETRAVEPLDRTALWEKGELPETFLSGY